MYVQVSAVGTSDVSKPLHTLCTVLRPFTLIFWLVSAALKLWTSLKKKVLFQEESHALIHKERVGFEMTLYNYPCCL